MNLRSHAVQPGRNGSTAHKVLDLDALASRLDAERGLKRKIVHCHGVFDLLHVGHIRHFSEAKALGDVLVVTITPDQYVNKGPNRPAFPQALRAEAIAALGMVDYVAINHWPTAENAIKRLKPDVYVKGPDYKDAAKDVTGGIRIEEEAVRSVGGELRFTEDITFSSSKLLNTFMPQLQGASAEFLSGLRQRHSGADVAAMVNGFQNLKVLVVGEAILDEYVYCNAMGKSSKEPILALQYLSKEIFAGGSLAIANHLAEFCAQVDLVAYLGSDDSREDFVRARLKANVRPHFIRKHGSPTIVKRRFVQKYQLTKLLEIYEMNDAPLDAAEDAALCEALEARLPENDIALAADFGHGLVTARAVERLATRSRFLSVMTQINAANIGFHTVSKYPRADYICIQENELRLDHRNREDGLRPLIENIAKRLRCEAVMTTRGNEGTLLYRASEGFSECPAFAIKVVDRVGAGDAVLALTTLAAQARLPADVLGLLGNLAGAQAVNIVGNSASISKVALLKSVESLFK